MTTPIVLAHGFTQTARSWDIIAPLLAGRALGAVTAVDLPGHGAAGDVRSDLWGCADHLVERGGRATYVGYSMGGRVCLHAALAHPDSVERLVLIGASPGIEDETERARRREEDDELADRLEAIGVERFIDEWLDNSLFAGLTPTTALRADRLRNTAAGLASSLRLAGTGAQAPLWGRLEELTMPVLLVVGERDAKFRGIAERMSAVVPHAVVRTIDDAGHSVHLEQPEATVDAIAHWLDQHG